MNLEPKNLREIVPCEHLEEAAHDGGCHSVGMTLMGVGVGGE
jgi:hypothetical protein